ncbi:MAG: hypothetical protein J0L93_08655 [Deltaproteobacteria bacterium]|nr:hypothetical protein [Deltaproteobacteria bacterium]
MKLNRIFSIIFLFVYLNLSSTSLTFGVERRKLDICKATIAKLSKSPVFRSLMVVAAGSILVGAYKSSKLLGSKSESSLNSALKTEAKNSPDTTDSINYSLREKPASTSNIDSPVYKALEIYPPEVREKMDRVFAKSEQKMEILGRKQFWINSPILKSAHWSEIYLSKLEDFESDKSIGGRIEKLPAMLTAIMDPEKAIDELTKDKPLAPGERREAAAELYRSYQMSVRTFSLMTLSQPSALGKIDGQVKAVFDEYEVGIKAIFDDWKKEKEFGDPEVAKDLAHYLGIALEEQVSKTGAMSPVYDWIESNNWKIRKK